VQLVQLQKMKQQLDELGYQIIAVSPDRPAKLKQTIEQLGLEYELLSDSEIIFAGALGIAYQVDKRTRESYLEAGIDYEEYSGLNTPINNQQKGINMKGGEKCSPRFAPYILL